jgi:GNAT superfamily N-acetyltransferase
MAHYVAQLDDRQVEEACRHTHPFWGRRRTLEEHTERSFRQLETAGPALLRYVGWVDGTGAVLCALKRYSVLLAVPTSSGMRQVRTVGIGSVFTAEGHRGQGAARSLLRVVLEEAREHGDEAALLYSDIAPSFYARLGFVEYPAVDFTAATEALPHEGALTTRPAAPEDTERLRTWYEASYPEDFLRCVRDPALWRYFHWHNSGGEVSILGDGDGDVGYVHLRPAGDVLSVEEWAAPAVSPPRLWATLRTLADAAGASRITGWLRPDQIDARFAPSHRDRAIPMVADLTGDLGLPAIDPQRSHFSPVDHF